MRDDAGPGPSRDLDAGGERADIPVDGDREDLGSMDVRPEDVPEDTAGELARDADAGDTQEEAESGPDPCDDDGDGARSELCGGDDCDDGDPRIFPDAIETCDFVDNNCDGRLNDGASCSFFAHTADQLFRIDPFRGLELFVTDAPNLFDFDTDTSGALWGISPNTLYRFDDIRSSWEVMASLDAFTQAPNGFAIDSRGNAYATAGNELYGIDLEAGEWHAIGPFGGDYESSGDCVVDKNDVLYMTSKSFGEDDTLVRIDSSTGAAVPIGSIGFRAVYGLTAAWGFLFGVTSSGELIEIDPGTGAGTLLFEFEDRRWFGAASSSAR